MPLSIEEFGAHLLTTGDLDPVYIALNRCAFSDEVRNRWLIAYCAFYHCGVASYISQFEGKLFWDIMMSAAENKVPAPTGSRWSRSSERRHFRGQQAIKGIEDWQSKFPYHPETMMDYIAQSAPSFTDVCERAKAFRSVGNWLSFKIADLIDACMDIEIDQSDVMLFMYETPRNSLLRLWRERNQYNENVKPKDEDKVIKGMVEYYTKGFKDFECPHKPGKPVDMFCQETIYCKYQSHLNGHYPLYNDIDEISHGLMDWLPHSENARLFASRMPKHGT